MSLFKTAYATTACSGFVLRPTLEAAQNALVANELEMIEDAQIYCVRGASTLGQAIPAFAHPMLVHDARQGEHLLVDLRFYGQWNPQQAQFEVRNDIEQRLAVHRAKLNWIWVFDRSTLLRDVSTLPMAAYASWVSEAVSRRFALDALEQFKLQVYAAIFYETLFREADTIEADDEHRVAGSIARVLRASVNDVLPILQDCPPLPNVTAFAKHAAEVTGAVRLRGFDVRILYAVLGGTWYGTNARENVAVALEHPPTWLSLLMAAFAERSFKKSGITQITERPSMRDAGKDFLRSILSLVRVSEAS